MLNLSQRDPRWAAKKIGPSNLTLGDFGCTTTCISMLTDYFNCYKDPVEIQKFQDYNLGGLILWPTLRLPPMHFVKRLNGQHDADIQESIKDPHKAVILEVALKDPTKHHWLTVLSKLPLLNVYMVVDPWDGKKKTTAAYGNRITGSAHYSNK